MRYPHHSFVANNQVVFNRWLRICSGGMKISLRRRAAPGQPALFKLTKEGDKAMLF